jgi:Flp pilus assembly pilin Flp
VSTLFGLIVLEAFMFQVLRRSDHKQRGQGLAEYALILGLIAVVAIVALLFLGTTISSMLSHINATL